MSLIHEIIQYLKLFQTSSAFQFCASQYGAPVGSGDATYVALRRLLYSRLCFMTAFLCICSVSSFAFLTHTICNDSLLRRHPSPTGGDHPFSPARSPPAPTPRRSNSLLGLTYEHFNMTIAFYNRGTCC